MYYIAIRFRTRSTKIERPVRAIQGFHQVIDQVHGPFLLDMFGKGIATSVYCDAEAMETWRLFSSTCSKALIIQSDD